MKGTLSKEAEYALCNCPDELYKSIDEVYETGRPVYIECKGKKLLVNIPEGCHNTEGGYLYLEPTTVIWWLVIIAVTILICIFI